MAFSSYGSIRSAVGADAGVNITNMFAPPPAPRSATRGPPATRAISNRGMFGARLAGFNARLEGSAMGRALKMGTMESFGWHFAGTESQGFLGLRGELGSVKGMKGVAGNIRKGGLGLVGRTLGKSLGLLSTAYFAYEGYQQEGVWGAAKGVGESIAYSAAFNYVVGAAGGTALAFAAPVAGIAALAGGAYMLGEAGIKHKKGLRDLEMGGGDQMMQAVTSAGAATARQRAVMALNNTHVNGRMALGNEGFLMHRGFSA